MAKYAPFLDSTPLRTEPDRLRARLAHLGYLFLRGMLPEDEVAEVRRRVLAVADKAGWLLPVGATGDTSTAAPAAAVWDPDPAYRIVHRQMWAQRPVHALMHHPDLLTVITQLLGADDVLIHPRKVLRAVHPRPAPTIHDGGWHQDFPEIQGSANTLTVWTPLAPVAPGTGALAVVPGSHAQGTFPLRLAPTAVGWEADVHPVIAHTSPMQPGDILVFTAHTVHRGTANSGTGLRLSLDTRYQPPTEPINETCLELRDEAYGWDAVYSQWPNPDHDPLVRYWQRQTLNVAPYDQTYDQWREQTALAAGARRDPAARRALEITAMYGQPANAEQAGALLTGLPTT